MTERPISIRSIPPRTMINVLREGARISVRIGGLGTGAPRQGRLEREYFSDVRPYVSPEPGRKKPRETFVLPESEGITWQVEEVEDYNDQEDLGLILQYSGIELPRGPFIKSRVNYGADNIVFFLPVRYGVKVASLILSTFGDIFESQVAAKKDVNPFFREELYLPPLATTHDPKSMTVKRKNNLVIVSYKLRSP